VKIFHVVLYSVTFVVKLLSFITLEVQKTSFQNVIDTCHLSHCYCVSKAYKPAYGVLFVNAQAVGVLNVHCIIIIHCMMII